MERSPKQTYGTHLCRRLLEGYDGSQAPVRGGEITLAQADAFVEGCVAALIDFAGLEGHEPVSRLALLKKHAKVLGQIERGKD